MSNICPGCLKNHKENNWYISPGDVKIETPAGCDFHPVMNNWRVFRTLKTIKSWSLEPGGYCHKHLSGVIMTYGGGHVDITVAQKILFDYEIPFIELLVKDGYLQEHLGFPTTLTVTPKGDKLIQSRLQQEGREHV